MATSGLSNDTCNFQCVTVASVAVIKLPLRDILANHIQPQDLFQKIQSCSTLKLRQDQLKLCCIPPPDVPDYNKFDVTLLYTLIRNLCSLPRPAQGWGNEPTANDTQISDDIERLRLFRNNFYAHAESAVIADAVFKDVWKNLKLVFRRIQPKMGYSVDYEEELMNIERTKFTDDFLANFRVLLETFAKFEIQTDGRDEPDIFIQGENEIICGSTAQIEAEVKKVESSCWSITWRKRRGDVIKCIDTDMEKYKGSSKKTLVINSVCKEDEGEYQAVLSPELNGPEYKSRNTIRLHAVGEIPFLTISEVSLGSEGITIHFNCGVLEQSPKVHLIEWSKNGKKLDNKSNKYVGEGIDNRQLTITSPTYEDRGKYNCKVSNAVGSVSKNVMLDVPCVELLEVSPIFCGSKTAIKCVISSTPTPENIEWQTSRDGVDFQSIRRAKYFDNTDNSFVIHKATFADKLYYRLRVWNGIGETISNTVYLNVTGSPPNIKTIPETNIKNRSVKLIGSVIIYDDSPGVKNHFWTRNQKTIDFEECNGRLSETRTDNPSLTITNVGPDDAGEYRLTAMNDVGSFTSEAIVLGVPRVSEEKVEDEDNGGQRITVTIKSIPEPCHVQWSVKRKEDDTFVQIDIYAKEYEGTTVTLPHPVLFVKQKDQLENICFRIEVTNFIGNTQREISGNCTTKQRKIDNVENTIYNDDGEIFEFTILSSTLVKQFPIGKLDHLKFLIKKSNKVKNPASVKEATSVLECIDILQDENLFTPTDVIYMQFLCQEADCFDLFTKCVEYAESKQRALCYFKKPPVNGYKDVQFHVQGDVSGYTKDYINHVIKTVAVILRCKEEDVLLNGAQHSKSFLLSLSIKEPYVRKLLALEVKDRLKLRGLNIDYLIIDGNILDIEIPKGKEAVFESNDKMNPMEKESTHSSMMRSQEDGASIDVPSVRIFVDSPVCFGSETIIKSVVSSTPTPRKTEWQKSKDGIDFHLIGKPNIYLGSNENFKNPFLVIPKTTFADKLFYRLWVWNRVGKSASNTFYLNVTGSPPNITTSFVTNIKNKSVKLMGEVYFLENSPGILKTLWTKNGEKINIKESGGKLSELITDNPSLTITDVGPDDAGEYKVTAVNAVGSTTSEVIVLGIPSVFSERVEDEINGGRRITVTITSFPAPCQIRWNAKSKDDDTFTPIDINAEEYDGTTVTFPHPVLVVRQRDQLENNCYQIEVTNFIGKIVQTISGNKKPTVRKKDIVQNTFYKDCGARVRFTKLSNVLAKEFPPQKLENLKFTLTNLNIVQNRTSVMEATSALQCLRILQDEELFTQTDVIVMQFLCTQTECLDLHSKCVEYAEQQKALCYFEKPPVHGYKNAQFHVKGELSSYTKDYIQDVLETVAAILDCKEEDILLNGVRHSNSFLLSLSVKEVYMKKLLALNEQDRLRLVRLNIDYLIIDKETLYLERPKAAYLGPRTTQSFKERNLSTGVQLRNQEDQQPALIRSSSLDPKDQQPALIRSSSLDPKFLQRPPSHRSITRSLSVPLSISFVDQLPLTEEPEPNDKDPERHCDSEKKDPEKHQVRCIECVKAIPVFSCHDIEAGDHVVFSGAVYDHHGIIISKLDDDETFEIIESTNTISGAVLGVSKFFGGKAEIKCSFKKFDFDGEKICVVVYRHRFSKEETVRRATGFYNRKEDSKKYKYDLFDNNCEHFATYCVTGQNFSVQVSKFRLTWKLFLSSGFVGVSDELERNKKEFENGIICDDCYEMNKKLLGVGVKPIVSERDVQKGDIIRYSYWNLWHDAVVLEVSNTNKNSVVCSIAHYAFCGPFSHRTIKEEMKEIPFNGQSLKLDYAPPQYDVYEPDKVVKRARKRLGEQLFVFFSNDSSHFARWCKLKLRRS